MRESGVTLLELLVTLTIVMQRRASDIHIEAADRSTRIKLRVDGILVPAMEPLDIRLHAPLVSRLKVMSDLDIAERRVPQDGSFRMRLERKTVDFRVSILPSVFGESVVIRILDREAISSGVSTLRLDRLGFNEEDLKRFRRAITKPYGMVLVTGPTGSGKTTTLYAAITEMNIKEDKLITIEDPVEYQFPGVVQIPVNEKKGLTFARGLRSILRHEEQIGISRADLVESVRTSDEGSRPYAYRNYRRSRISRKPSLRFTHPSRAYRHLHAGSDHERRERPPARGVSCRCHRGR